MGAYPEILKFYLSKNCHGFNEIIDTGKKKKKSQDKKIAYEK